ncbi:MAG: aldehyde dehydrogenase family protein [Mycetocola sp.]
MTQTTVQPFDTFLIGGQWVSDDGRTQIPVTNPTTEETITSVSLATIEDAERATTAAVTAFASGPWTTMSYADRAAYLDRVADGFIARSEELADIYVADQGGLRAFASFVNDQAVAIIRYYADLGRRLPQGPQERTLPDRTVLINKLPVGPVLASVPWNAPTILAAVKFAPALLAGCPVIIKSDPQAPLAPRILGEILHAAQFPDGVVSLIVGGGDVGRYLVAHPAIRHVSFTGSTQVGRDVATSASANFTRLTLELGGKGASIILDDIDPSEAIGLLYPGSLTYSGQVCTTSSRLLVPRSRYEEWRDALVTAFESFPVGDPNAPETLVGPLISEAQRSRVETYIEGARQEGATILAGGGRPAGIATGYFVEPTLVGDVTPDMTIAREEVFGPVITLQSYGTEAEALAIANSTEFGLANVIITNDVPHAVELSARLVSGTVSINNFGSCLTEPFGGMGHSGIGREGGVEGFEAFLEYQQIQLPAGQ